MSNSMNGPSIEVSLVDSDGDANCVKIEFPGEVEQVLRLTPQQARSLASELIQMVYKAEVKSSLQRNKRQVDPASERVVQGSFPGPRIVGAQ